MGAARGAVQCCAQTYNKRKILNFGRTELPKTLYTRNFIGNFKHL